MRKQMFVRPVAFAAAVALVTACGADQLTSPAVSAHPTQNLARLLPTQSALVSALLRTRPLARDVVAGAIIGPEGGSFQIPEAGVQVVVPAGAVQSPTAFSVKALKGLIAAYDFSPAGAVFQTPLQVTQSLQGTVLERVPNLANLQGAYFASSTQLDQLRGQAYVNELEPTVVGAGGGKVTFAVSHFSGYIVASGFLAR
jgi:hypothetical protein